MIDVVVFVWGFEDGFLDGVNRRVDDGNAGFMVLEFVAAVTGGEFIFGLD